MPRVAVGLTVYYQLCHCLCGSLLAGGVEPMLINLELLVWGLRIFNDYGQLIFVTRKVVWISCVFFHAEFKYVIKTVPSPAVFMWQNFLKFNFSEINFLATLTACLNMGLYCSLNIVWACKLNHNKDSRHVSPITDSQTGHVHTCSDMMGHETNSKFCLKSTALLVVYLIALW
jgi:hypothetical protein